jgi:uncharacterized membrane protein
MSKCEKKIIIIILLAFLIDIVYTLYPAVSMSHKLYYNEGFENYEQSLSNPYN